MAQLDKISAERYSPSLRCGSNSAVECHLAKVDVEGSNPFSRSNFVFAREGILRTSGLAAHRYRIPSPAQSRAKDRASRTRLESLLPVGSDAQVPDCYRAGMARRPADEQVLHDRVIQALVRKLSGDGRRACGNPGRKREFSVVGYYPDVLLSLGGEGPPVAWAIYEVETWSSIEETHAERQWAELAALALPFFLVVPDDSVAETRRILGELDIAVAGVIPFSFSPDDTIAFGGKLLPGAIEEMGGGSNDEPSSAERHERMALLDHAKPRVELSVRAAVAEGTALEDIVVLVVDGDDRVGRVVAEALLVAQGSSLEEAFSQVAYPSRPILTTSMRRADASFLISALRLGGDELMQLLEKPAPGGSVWVVVVGAGGALLIARSPNMKPIGSA